MNESFKNSEFILDVTHSVGDIIYNVYNQGYEDGLKDGKESVQIDESTAYKAGLEAAWELARKLSNLGYNDTRKEIFGEKYGLSIDIIKNFSVDEVMTKIKNIPIRCEILHDKCPYHLLECMDCNLYTAFHEVKKDMEELNDKQRSS